MYFPRKTLSLLPFLLLGCSAEDKRENYTGGSVFPSRPDAGTAGSGGSAGSSGTSGSSGSSGQTTDPDTYPEGPCGNNALNRGEQCDGSNIAEQTCNSQGFTEGELACKSDCSFDFSACSGTEECFNGRDDDGDGKVDCDDSDCASACADLCSGAVALVNGVTKSAVTSSSNLLKNSCGAAPLGGPDTMFSFTPTVDGVLDIKLESSRVLEVGVSKTCGSPTQLACGFAGANTSVQAVKGETLFLMVEGLEPQDSGAFTITATERVVTCGDARRDLGEECDDGGTDNGDGCSSKCLVEQSVASGNGTFATATLITLSDTEPAYLGQLTTGGRVHYLKFAVQQAGKLYVQLNDFGDGSCSFGTLDTTMWLYDAAEKDIYGNNAQDSGDGYCSAVTGFDVAEGTYYLKVGVLAQYSELPAGFKIQAWVE